MIALLYGSRGATFGGAFLSGALVARWVAGRDMRLLTACVPRVTALDIRCLFLGVS